MANIKISELNSIVEKDYTDVLPIVDTSANETKKISIEKLIDNNVELLDVIDIAPSECSIGDKYYNTEDNLIYTAVDTDTWSSTGEQPKSGVFYIVFSKQSNYVYDGTTLVSVGGGSGDLIMVNEEPTEDTKLQIESNDLDPQGTYITNTESQSTTLGYSAAYTNARNTYSTNETFTGKYWIDGKPIYRKAIEITDTNASASNWKEYTYTTLGLPSTIELCMFPEAYTQITQANKLYTESFYSNGSRVQTAPADSKVNVLGNGATYSKYIIIAEYTKTTD